MIGDVGATRMDAHWGTSALADRASPCTFRLDLPENSLLLPPLDIHMPPAALLLLRGPPEGFLIVLSPVRVVKRFQDWSVGCQGVRSWTRALRSRERRAALWRGDRWGGPWRRRNGECGANRGGG